MSESSTIQQRTAMKMRGVKVVKARNFDEERRVEIQYMRVLMRKYKEQARAEVADWNIVVASAMVLA